MRTLFAVVVLVGATFSYAAIRADEQVKTTGSGLAERIQDLNLTDAQEAKITNIVNEHRPKVQAAAKELHALVKEEMDKIRALLTPEQKQKLQAMKEERSEHRVEGLAQAHAHLNELDLTEAEMAKIEQIRKQYRPKIETAMKELDGILTDQQRKIREEGLKSGEKRGAMLASLKLTDVQKEKVAAVGKNVGNEVREEMEKIRDVLTEEQKATLSELKDERKETVRNRMAHVIVNLKDLNLTPDQKTKMMDIRKEFRPKVHEAGNKLRGAVRDEVAAIVSVMKQ
jgi:Spy/CpxP family protein refolding chaperone